MSLVVKYDPSTSAGFERPTGLQQAILSSIFDLGDKPDPFKEGKLKHQIAITWQLKETFTNKEGKTLPLQQTEIYNLSLHEKSKLRGVVEGMIGKSIGKGDSPISVDLEKLIGRNCMLTLQKKPDTDFTSVISAAPLLANMTHLTIVDLPIPQWLLDLKSGKSDQVPKEKLLAETVADVDISDFMATV
jgi:hypothetical protein